MAASNYMTEADVESIWDTEWNTARFGKIGIRIAEMLNFLVTGDATSQITDTSVIPILEQISEEILLELALAAKANAIIVPWDFIHANISNIDWQFYDNYMLKKVRQKVNSGATMEIVSRTLPSTTDSSVIP